MEEELRRVMSPPSIEQAASFANLLHAFYKARLAKKGRGGEPAFFVDLEENLLNLGELLRSGRWTPREYRRFHLWTGKERVVAEAAFVDRVVHHSLVATLTPAFEPWFSGHSYACRKGMGVHGALLRAKEQCRTHRFALRMDVKRYFETMDHQVLMHLLRQGLLRMGEVDEGLIELCRLVLQVAPSGTESPPGLGLPIGNLTSQFWANVYLDPVDQEVEGGGCPTWSRYMDDMLAFSNDKSTLWRWQEQARAVVEDQLRLKLKPTATWVAPVGEGVPWLGFRVFPGLVRIRASARKRYARKLAASMNRAALAEAGGDEEAVLEEVGRTSSLVGHLLQANTLALRRSLVEAIGERQEARRKEEG